MLLSFNNSHLIAVSVFYIQPSSAPYYIWVKLSVTGSEICGLYCVSVTVLIRLLHQFSKFAADADTITVTREEYLCVSDASFPAFLFFLYGFPALFYLGRFTEVIGTEKSKRLAGDVEAYILLKRCCL